MCLMGTTIHIMVYIITDNKIIFLVIIIVMEWIVLSAAISSPFDLKCISFLVELKQLMKR